MSKTEYSDGLQAITTKYLGPTNARGSRIKATAAAGSLTIECDDRWNQDDNHRAAACALMQKLNWTGKLYMGGLKNNDRVFVQVEFYGLDRDVMHTCNEITDGRPPTPVALKRLLCRVLSAIR